MGGMKRCMNFAVSCFSLLPYAASFSITPIKRDRSNIVIEASASVESTPLGSTDDLFKKHVQNTYSKYPISMVKGKNCLLLDEDGNEYLDMVAGISTCALGHANDDLIAAIVGQMKTLHHVSNVYQIPQQARLAQWLTSNSCTDKAFFCNSGAEANEAAIKLVRKYAHQKMNIDIPIIITAKQSFHGRTLATITATGQPKYQKDFDPLPSGFTYVEYNNVDELRKVVKKINRMGKIRKLLGMKRTGVAGILMEPLQGEGGVVPATSEYFKAIRSICDETGALMMCDEVQTGMGRTGSIWGYENLGVEPDVISCAKALGGGVPIGAMLCKEKCAVFKPGDHASTFGGNPLACAAGLVISSKLSEGRILKNVQERGEQLRAGLNSIVLEYGEYFSSCRGWGLINGLVIRNEADLIASDVITETIKAGLLLIPAGPKVIRMVPPLIISHSEIENCLRILRSVIKKVVENKNAGEKK